MTEPKSTASRCDTIVSLRDYFEARLSAMERALDLARELVERRQREADQALEHRLQGLNELRGDVVTKGECRARSVEVTGDLRSEIVGLKSDVAMLREWKAEQRGKASMLSVYFSYAIGLTGVLLSVIAIIQRMMQ